MKSSILKFFLYVFCIFATFLCYSQEIKGSVFDENKIPLQGVSIYLDGTTTDTNSDANGEFYIKTAKINTTLIISAIGYETLYVSNPFENNNQKFYLIVKNEALDEIVIRKELFTRKQKLSVFKTFFLGKTKAGKRCKILNEDDIDLVYDYKKNILSATSRNPVRILNNYLEYDLSFDIYKFNIYFNQKSISEYEVSKSMFLGTTLYKSLSESDKVIKKRRTVYYGSKAHFFKNLSNGVWDNKNFILFKGSFKTDAKQHFLIIREPTSYKITILENDVKSFGLAADVFRASFNILYNKKVQSKMIFRTPIFYVDDFGNNSDGENIEVAGALSYSKIGDLLPLNYEL